MRDKWRWIHKRKKKTSEKNEIKITSRKEEENKEKEKKMESSVKINKYLKARSEVLKDKKEKSSHTETRQ